MKLRSIRFPRRLVQFGCLLAFIAIPFLNRAEINVLAGNFLAFNFAGIPLSDPLSALQVFAASRAGIGPILIGALIALSIAFLLGPAFCSWLCPYGFLSELVHGKKEARAAEPAAVNAARELFPAAKPAGKAQKSGPSDRPFLSRLCVVGTGLLLTATIVPFPVLNQLSMPGWYSRVMQNIPLYSTLLWGGAALLLGVLVLERISGKRLWCRYICPQSVLISLAGMLFPKRLQVAFTRKKCTCPASDRACGKACSLCLDPRSADSPSQRVQCTNCGDCVDACRERGKALQLRFGKGE